MFTKRKFLNLPFEQQHKKCAEILREIYEINNQEKLDYYNEVISWMGEIAPLPMNKKLIADAYHKHLGSSTRFLKEHNLLPSIRKGDKSYAQSVLPIDIYLDQIRSGHNVGSIIRTIEAFSLGSIYFSKDTPFIDNKKVIDTSMGSHLFVNAYKNEDLKELKRPIIALETSDLASSLYDFIFPESFTLVVGNEEYGCTDDTLHLADHILEIPLRGHKNSINVANALAITANEIIRQLNF